MDAGQIKTLGGIGLLITVAAVSAAILRGGDKAAVGLVVREPVIDWGPRLAEDTPDKVVFELWNQGTDEVQVNEIAAGCPCVEPTLSVNPIPPGEVATLTILPRKPLMPGAWSERVVVHTSDPAQPVLALVVQGVMTVATECVPYINRVEGLILGQTREVAFQVVGPDSNLDFKILDAVASDERIKVLSVEREGVAAQSHRVTWQVRLSISSDARSRTREWQAEVTIQTNLDKGAQVRHPVHVTHRTLAVFDPNLLLIRADDRTDHAIRMRLDEETAILGGVPILRCPDGMTAQWDEDEAGEDRYEVFHVRLLRWAPGDPKRVEVEVVFESGAVTLFPILIAGSEE